MNKDKDNHNSYDNFDYQSYYDNFTKRVTRDPFGELNNIVFYYDYDSHL